MEQSRWELLMTDDDEEKLTEDEIREGWHFCPDWDGLLVGPGMEELDFCGCGLQ